MQTKGWDSDIVDDSILLRGKVGDWPVKAQFFRKKQKGDVELDESQAAKSLIPVEGSILVKKIPKFR